MGREVVASSQPIANAMNNYLNITKTRNESNP